jgi:NAD(P)H-dependent FMN reductase
LTAKLPFFVSLTQRKPIEPAPIRNAMTDEIIIMGICGTYSHDSANGHLLKMALDACSDLGVKTVTWDQEENPLPQVGAPDSLEDENVKSFQKLAKSADAYILSSPEYHGTMSGVMKNQLDWVYFEHVASKVWGVMSTLGGQTNSNTLNHMRLSARWLHGHVIPQQLAVGNIKEAFNEDGKFVDEKLTERLTEFAAALVDTTRRLKD